MNITTETMEEALTYLAETDQMTADARSKYENLCELRKVVKAKCFLKHSASSVAKNEYFAYQDLEYNLHLEKMEVAGKIYHSLVNKRKTKEIIIDCWRSLFSARNRANIQ